MWFYLEKQFVGKSVSCPAFYETQFRKNSVSKGVYSSESVLSLFTEVPLSVLGPIYLVFLFPAAVGISDAGDGKLLQVYRVPILDASFSGQSVMTTM